jgi:hypothetical protein
MSPVSGENAKQVFNADPQLSASFMQSASFMRQWFKSSREGGAWAGHAAGLRSAEPWAVNEGIRAA